MKTARYGFVVALLLAAAACTTTEQRDAATKTASAVPKYRVEPFWPKPLPHDWILGQVSGVAVDAEDNVWIIQRPGSLTPDEKGAALCYWPRRCVCRTKARWSSASARSWTKLGSASGLTTRSRIYWTRRSTAKTHGLIVATLNVRHFSLIPQLPVEDWSIDLS